MLVVLTKKKRQRRIRFCDSALCFPASPSRWDRCTRALPGRTRSGSGRDSRARKAADLLDLLRTERGDIEDLLSFLQADPGEAGSGPGLGARPPARLGGRLAGCSGRRRLRVSPRAESPENARPAPPGPVYLRTPAAARGRRRGPAPGRPPGRSAPGTWPAETAAVTHGPRPADRPPPPPAHHVRRGSAAQNTPRRARPEGAALRPGSSH